MNEPTMDKLVQRLDCLERDNCRLKRFGALVILVIAAVVLTGQSTISEVVRVVEAEKFVLRDSSGRERAILTASDRNVSFSLYDRRGAIGVSLETIDGKGYSLFLTDERSKIRLLLRSKEGKPKVMIIDRNGRIRAVLGRTSDKEVISERTPYWKVKTELYKNRPESSLVLYGKQGRLIWSTP